MRGERVETRLRGHLQGPPPTCDLPLHVEPGRYRPVRRMHVLRQPHRDARAAARTRHHPSQSSLWVRGTRQRPTATASAGPCPGTPTPTATSAPRCTPDLAGASASTPSSATVSGSSAPPTPGARLRTLHQHRGPARPHCFGRQESRQDAPHGRPQTAPYQRWPNRPATSRSSGARRRSRQPADRIATASTRSPDRTQAPSRPPRTRDRDDRIPLIQGRRRPARVRRAGGAQNVVCEQRGEGRTG